MSKPAKADREHVQNNTGAAEGGTSPAAVPTPPGARVPCGLTNSGAECAKENAMERSPPLPAPSAGRGGARDAYRMSKRLPATDISALASMKNVAKCDTWCELQNPVNHRVFERKLRPKPLGRGHACLGVTHRVAPTPSRGIGGGDWPPVRAAVRAAGPNANPPLTHVATSGG